MEADLTVQPLINCRIIGMCSPIVALEDVKPKMMERINIYANGRKLRGQIIEIRGTRSWAKVYESLAGIGLGSARVECTGDVFKMPLSEDMIGQFFDGSGNSKDPTFASYPERYADIEPRPINPVCFKSPAGIIQTGIGAIDLLNNITIGKGYTIYSAAGLPHNDLAAQIIRQATVLTPSEQNSSKEFTIVFAGISLTSEAMRFFTTEFRKMDTKHKVTSFMNGNADPDLERLLTPRLALTFAEYLAFEKHKHVLVVLTDMAAYCDAMRLLAPTPRGNIELKYPTNLASDLALLLDRSGMVEGSSGSITVMPIVTVPNDDIDSMSMFGGVTYNFLVLDRGLHNRGFYPPMDFWQPYKICRAVYGVTREDHFSVSFQIYHLYLAALEVAEYRAIVGESTISDCDLLHIEFLDKFERRLLKQSRDEAWSDNAKLLDVAWELLRMFPRDWLSFIPERLRFKYYDCRK